MSLRKNKKNFSKGRKDAKRKVGERFTIKEWWNIKAPGMFLKRIFTHSPVNQTADKKLTLESMKGRIFEANLGDLDTGYEFYKKLNKNVEDADGKSRIALINFYGLECTRDYLCSLIWKWHTLIDLFVDCKTNDGSLMRFFVPQLYQQSPLSLNYQKRPFLFYLPLILSLSRAFDKSAFFLMYPKHFFSAYHLRLFLHLIKFYLIEGL